MLHPGLGLHSIHQLRFTLPDRHVRAPVLPALRKQLEVLYPLGMEESERKLLIAKVPSTAPVRTALRSLSRVCIAVPDMKKRTPEAASDTRGRIWPAVSRVTYFPLLVPPETTRAKVGSGLAQ